MDNSPYVSILRDVFSVRDVSALEEERARANAVPEAVDKASSAGPPEPTS